MKQLRSESRKEIIRNAWAAWRMMGGCRQVGAPINRFPAHQQAFIIECRRAWLRWKSVRNNRSTPGPLFPR